MRRTKLLFVFSLVVTVSTAMAEEKPGTSPSMPPCFRKVFQINQRQGELILVNRTVRFVAETGVKAAKQDGKVENVVATTYKPVYEERARIVAVESAEVFEAGGKKLTSDDVWKRISVGAIVLVSADGKKVAPEYLSTLAKDTLVFVSPQYALQDRPADDREGGWSARPASGQSLKARVSRTAPIPP